MSLAAFIRVLALIALGVFTLGYGWDLWTLTHPWGWAGSGLTLWCLSETIGPIAWPKYHRT